MRERMNPQERERVNPHGNHPLDSTLFVYNIHKNTSKKELYDCLKGDQTITDIFISRKKRINTNFLFAFVRVQNQKEAKELCNRCNGSVLRGIKLFIKPSRFNRIKEARHKLYPSYQPRQIQPPRRIQSSRSWSPANRDQRSYKQVLERGNQGNDNVIVPNRIQNPLVPCPDKEEWLRRCLVISTINPTDVPSVALALNTMDIETTSVKDLGCFKFIISFQSAIKKARALQILSSSSSTEFILEVKEWESIDRGAAWLLWIEIWGIPIHVWNKENISFIGEKWGTVVRVDKDAEQERSYRKATVLVECSSFVNFQNSTTISTASESFTINARIVKWGSVTDLLDSKAGEIMSRSEKPKEVDDQRNTKSQPEMEKVSETSGMDNGNNSHNDNRSQDKSDNAFMRQGSLNDVLVDPLESLNGPNCSTHLSGELDPIIPEFLEPNFQFEAQEAHKDSESGNQNRPTQKRLSGLVLDVQQEPTHKNKMPILESKHTTCEAETTQSESEGSYSKTLVSDPSIPPGFEESIPKHH